MTRFLKSCSLLYTKSCNILCYLKYSNTKKTVKKYSERQFTLLFFGHAEKKGGLTLSKNSNLKHPGRVHHTYKAQMYLEQQVSVKMFLGRKKQKFKLSHQPLLVTETHCLSLLQSFVPICSCQFPPSTGKIFMYQPSLDLSNFAALQFRAF